MRIILIRLVHFSIHVSETAFNQFPFDPQRDLGELLSPTSLYLPYGLFYLHYSVYVIWSYVCSSGVIISAYMYNRIHITKRTTGHIV